MKYQVNLESFSGPLDLLMHLIEKEEIDIYNIPIAKITEEYLSYIQTIEELDLDNVSEFLLMALNLLQIKAALLLPEPVQDKSSSPREDDLAVGGNLQQELVEKLVEYRKFKKAAQVLSQWESIEKTIYCRTPEDYPKEEEYVLGEITLGQLTACFKKLLANKQVKKDLTRVIILEEYTVEERMEQILDTIRQSQTPVEFNQIFLKDRNRLAIITSFLALLELIKLREIKIRQDSSFTPILITIYNKDGEI